MPFFGLFRSKLAAVENLSPFLFYFRNKGLQLYTNTLLRSLKLTFLNPQLDTLQMRGWSLVALIDHCSVYGDAGEPGEPLMGTLAPLSRLCAFTYTVPPLAGVHMRSTHIPEPGAGRMPRV